MLPGLLGAIVVAPFYWILVPERYRREAVALASLGALALYDPSLVVVVSIVSVGLYLLVRAVDGGESRHTRLLTGMGLVLLAVLFVWNKIGGDGAGALPAQSGLVLLGVSYLVLKVASALIESARGTLSGVTFKELLTWIVFLPTYPSGPMEDFEHFRKQVPVFDSRRVLAGLERILLGLLKALIAAHYLGEWAASIIAAPEEHGRAVLLLGLYAYSLRFYFDFSGYSDIAIGLGAVFGYEIEENFDNPLVRRNLVQLWQHWHMTLTRWLRLYVFIPVTRWTIRRGRRWGDRSSAVVGQVLTMTVCGLWHGLAWNFAVWGLLQAVGLIWVGVVARDFGRRLPGALVMWWRRSRVAYVLSVALTFNAFALSLIFVVCDTTNAVRYLLLLVGL